MENKILRFWRENLLPEHCEIICAVSGGADSIAMLLCLKNLEKTLSITVRAAHFNHRLRGRESDRDEAFVRDFCEKRSIPLSVGSADVRLRAEKTGESIEEAARNERYAFFHSLGGIVATAHTADDNLETVLFHLIRGTGLTGLGGIAPMRGNLIRPMLCTEKAELLTYLAERDIPHVEDSTNAENGCVRNRIRHELLPLLKAENPSAAEGTLQMSARLRKEDAFLDRLAGNVLEKAANEKGVCRSVLLAQDEVLLARCVRLMLQGQKVRKMTARHIGSVIKLIASDDPSGSVSLPDGLVCMRQYDTVYFSHSEMSPEWEPVRLPENGSVCVSDYIITAHTEIYDGQSCDNRVRFALTASQSGYFVRRRQTGDSLLLACGHRSLKKIMIDRKIPKSIRGDLPVIADTQSVAAVYSLGAGLDRIAKPGEKAMIIAIKKKETEERTHD